MGGVIGSTPVVNDRHCANVVEAGSTPAFMAHSSSGQDTRFST